MKNTIRYDETRFVSFYTHEIYEHVADLFESFKALDPEQYYGSIVYGVINWKRVL